MHRHPSVVVLLGLFLIGCSRHPQEQSTDSIEDARHLLFQDADSDKMMTGHVERVGLYKGAVVRLPNK